MVQFKVVIGSVLLFLGTIALAFAEDAANKKPLMMLDFRDAALVQMAITDVPSISIVTSRVNKMWRSENVPVTMTRKEERTRIVLVDGKQVQQRYTVSVPITVHVKQNINVQDSKVNEPVVIPIARVQARDVDGNKIDSADLAERISDAAAALLLKRPLARDSSIEPSHRALLQDDVVFLYCPDLNKNRVVIPPPRP